MEIYQLREQLYKRFIEPTKNNKKEYIGVEIELPIVNLNKKAVDFDVVHSINADFIEKFNFLPVGKDDEGNIYSSSNKQNGDILSYDCSYNNLEFSFGKEVNLFAVNERFIMYYEFLQKQFKKYNYTLTGMGVNPYRKYNNNVPIPNGRYRMLFHHLNSYKNYLDLPMQFHNYPEYGTFSSASQVQLDVDYGKLPTMINTFSKLEPVKALLFSNSVLVGEHEDLLCCRDMFWENSTHGINPHNIGMYDCKFETADEIISYLETTSIYCVERGEKYINFTPVQINEYFNKKEVTGEYYENGEYKQITFEPKIEDIDYLRAFKFEDVTFRGTVEFRSVCCQPIKDSMTVAAFHIGIKKNLEKVTELLDKDTVIYHNGYNATELRKLFLKDKLPSFVDENKLFELVKAVLDLSYDGLKQRNFGEEEFLKPLYKRLEKRTNPAKDMLSSLKNGDSYENIILEYAEVK
ncbi:MAG: glutamylcysteine synthetase [Ruminococcus sp.]|nr:glutamylcysteine synthetase [Ruminococcus sp.]